MTQATTVVERLTSDYSHGGGRGSEDSVRELERIAVPTTLIWGRDDRAIRLEIAEKSSARYGWPLHTTDDAGDDPELERPAAFLEALYGAYEALGSRPSNGEMSE